MCRQVLLAKSVWYGLNPPSKHKFITEGSGMEEYRVPQMVLIVYMHLPLFSCPGSSHSGVGHCQPTSSHPWWPCHEHCDRYVMQDFWQISLLVGATPQSCQEQAKKVQLRCPCTAPSGSRAGHQDQVRPLYPNEGDVSRQYFPWLPAA